jgi:septal ring factor EnvC (AmiA/AmiB activator)
VFTDDDFALSDAHYGITSQESKDKLNYEKVFHAADKFAMDQTPVTEEMADEAVEKMVEKSVHDMRLNNLTDATGIVMKHQKKQQAINDLQMKKNAKQAEKDAKKQAKLDKEAEEAEAKAARKAEKKAAKEKSELEKKKKKELKQKEPRATTHANALKKVRAAKLQSKRTGKPAKLRTVPSDNAEENPYQVSYGRTKAR